MSSAIEVLESEKVLYVEKIKEIESRFNGMPSDIKESYQKSVKVYKEFIDALNEALLALKQKDNDRKQSALEAQNKSNLIILDLLCQACDYDNIKGVIDNLCISAYEDACDYLKEQGILKMINERTYELNEKRIKELEEGVD